MSTHQSSTGADEMDLADIFSLFQRSFYKFLALCFKAFDFIIKFWWILLLLIAGGAALGYFTKGDPTYKSSLILKTNYRSQAYVYNAIKQFDENLSDGDIEFIKKVGLNPVNPGMGDINIEPVIDVVNLMLEMKVSDRTLGTIIEELTVEEDTELFATDRFYSNYLYHTLTVGLSGEESKENIQAILRYVNEQPLMQQLKGEATKNLKERIAHNEKTIAQIDQLIDSYGRNASGTVTDNLTYFNNQNNLNVNGTLTFKNELAIETELLKNDLVTYSEAAVIVSDIQTVVDKKWKDKKEIVYPALFVFVFLFLAGVRFTYKSLREEVEAQQLLN